MAYTLRASNFATNMVGSMYHIGIADFSRSYGYVFQNDAQQSQGMLEKSNVADKEKQIQYSSGALIDRDFAYYPRVSQGDFSGGALQQVLLDNTRCMDSDLNINVPAYLQLRPSWLRKTITPAGSISTPTNQIVAFNNDAYFTFGEVTGRVYKLGIKGAAVTFGSPVASAVISLFTDGSSLFAGTADNLYFETSGGALTTWGAITGGINGVATQWWEIEQGTSGRFNYYTVGTNPTVLYKVDMTAARPVAPANQPQVPTGGAAVNIVDLAAYQGGIAILSTDPNANNGFDVWYHDGVNMTRIVRADGYQAMGMTNCLGNLYIGCQDSLTFGGPILIQISSGGYQVVVRPSITTTYGNTQQCGQPRSSGEFVYWPVGLPNTPLGLTNAGTAVPRILVYNTSTGAVGYLPNLDNTDWIGRTNPLNRRALAVIGAAAGFVYVNNAFSVGTVQYQSLASGTFNYMASGWMVSSKVDFQTPGVPKRFRRIDVIHSPLQPGESITVRAFVDQDPTNFTPSLTPVPSLAYVNNSTAQATSTLLAFSADTVGRTMYFAIQINSSNTTTTPRVISTAVEVGGTWTWDFTLDCSSRRRTLRTPKDDQGVNGKDLYFLLRNSYENGNNVTLWLSPTLSYTCNIESLEGKNIAYANHDQQGVKADEEWLVHVVLRQIAS